MVPKFVHGQFGAIELHVRDGAGPTSVFLHGIGATASSWHGVVGLLPGRCVAWNAPGYAGSTALSGAIELHKYVDALSDVVNGLGKEPVHIVGHSWGGLLAASFARKFPLRVRSLALINPTPGYGGSPVLKREEILVERLSKICQQGPAALAREVAPRLIGPGATPSLLQKVEDLGVDITVQGMCDAVTILVAEELLSLLDAELTIPALVLSGEDDRIVRSELPLSIVHHLPLAYFDSIANCGHLAPLEFPERTATALRNLWNLSCI